MVDYGYDKWLHTNARKSPCYMCKERHHKCHSDCDRYLEFKEKRSKETETVRKQNELNVTEKLERKAKDRKWGNY